MKINKVFDYDDFDSDELQPYRNLFGGHTRKTWENLMLCYGADALQCGGRALGLGCLKEALMFVYANKFESVIATDRAYYPGKYWGKQHYDVDELYQYAKISYPDSSITFKAMDMKDIEFDDETFDYIWSSSSVEHVGLLPDVVKVFTEIDRVLKPNGICGITTEWNLKPTDTIIKFANVLCFDQNVLDSIDKATRLTLVSDLSVWQSDNPHNREKAFYRGKTNHGTRPTDYTSASIFWRKE